MMQVFVEKVAVDGLQEIIFFQGTEMFAIPLTKFRNLTISRFYINPIEDLEF
jgi:hypothetical protein